MHSFDLSLFYSIYNLSGHSLWIDRLIVDFGEYLLYPILVGVAALIVYEWRKKRWSKMWGYIVAVLGALIARFVIAEAIRLLYHRPRPFLALHLPHLLSDTSYSFPSGHTIFLFALATGVYRVNKRIGWALYALALFIGLARVAGGVHYPSDILGGIILGILISVVVTWLWKSIGRNIALPSI
jgi:undecaprenyl-diphosphatase